MTAQVVAFFNNKGGVGKTSLVYHLAWMYSLLGVRVVAADLDPQANLTAAFLDEDRLEELWSNDDHRQTMHAAVRPLILGVGDIADPAVEPVADALGLIAGDLALSGFEDELAMAAVPRPGRTCVPGGQRVLEDAPASGSPGTGRGRPDRRRAQSRRNQPSCDARR